MENEEMIAGGTFPVSSASEQGITGEAPDQAGEAGDQIAPVLTHAQHVHDLALRIFDRTRSLHELE